MVEERSSQQTEKLEELKNQISILNEGFGTAPSTIIRAADEVNRTTSEFVRHLSAMNETLENVQSAAMRLQERGSEPIDFKELDSYLEAKLQGIKQLLEELKAAQGQR